MTRDELKQAIREVVNEKLESAFYGDEIVRSIEAKLSPKYLPAGRIAEVWDNTDNWHRIRVANGAGRFFYQGNLEGDASRFDHYLEILTAQDAVKLLEAWTADLPHEIDTDDAFRQGGRNATNRIRVLIENAETG